MELLLQYVINGLLIGGAYSLTALSIVMIYKSTQIFNFAIGEIMTIGMFSAWSSMTLGVPVWGSIAFGLLVTVALGWAIERGAMRPLLGQPLIASIMATFGLAFILRAVILIVWRGAIDKYPEPLPGHNIQIGSILMSYELLWIFAMAMIGIITVILLFQRTKVGLEMRATAEHQQLAQARGVPVSKIFSVTWMISSMICGLAGIFIAFRLGVTPEISIAGLAAFPAVLLGGLESIPGALIGGLVIGLATSLTSGYLDPSASSIAPFVVLILVLVFKTEGLFGLKRIERI